MMEERYTIDDFKETKCCLTCRNWNVDNTLQGRFMFNTCRYMYENFKCAAMFPATWQCKHYDGSYTIDCPFGEREYFAKHYTREEAEAALKERNT